jgi:cobalt-zinc-cadmium efflux system membrane fusion protein
MDDRQHAKTERRQQSWLKFLGIAVLALVLGAGATLGAMLGVGGVLDKWKGASAHESPHAGAAEPDEQVELFRDAASRPGLRLTAEAMRGYDIKPVAAEVPTKPRAMPPQVGTVNYDNDRLFNIRTRFPGEVAEILKVKDTPSVPTAYRPLRAGDKVKQGDTLCVVWSQQLGQAKAALVDAISALALSKDTYERQSDLWKDGAMSFAILQQSLRQLRGDSNALATAERSLKMWKLTPGEIEAIRKEAVEIVSLIYKGKVRDTDMEAQWARVEIKVPVFDKTDPSRELTIVEKNTCLNDMLDPINSPAPLFKIADMNQLQIWVHPPEEYLPTLQKNLAAAEKEGRQLEWDIRFQADDPNKTRPQKMKIVQILPSLDPTQHTPMVVGYLNNARDTDPKGNGGADFVQRLVGQFVTATIYVPPTPNTVEIPAEALNEVGGEALVFVETNADKREFTLRRVPVEARYKDAVVVRTVLTPDDEKLSQSEQKQGRRHIEPLRAGDRVITRGVVELTSALEGLLVEERTKAESYR